MKIETADVADVEKSCRSRRTRTVTSNLHPKSPRRVVYDILFRAAGETLRPIAADPAHLGAEIGFLTAIAADRTNWRVVVSCLA